MKKSKAETAETRKRIVEVAARTFKHNGIEATGVAEIMANAGLSHGGFYRHFASKEQLVAEATAMSMEYFVTAASAAAAQGHDAFRKHIENYLSAEYRDDVPGGCPLAAMGSELIRTDTDTRRVASQGFEQLIDIIAQWMPSENEPSAKDDALFTLSSMVGALTMARLIDNPEVSQRILDVARKKLISLKTDATETLDSTVPHAIASTSRIKNFARVRSVAASRKGAA